MLTNALAKGILDGLRAPFAAISPPEVRTKVEPWVLKSSYISPREDTVHLQKYFERALACAKQNNNARKRNR
ncbi:hypothetical protein [Turicimonas muris]|uniref:hypothetical protein n=2 Tax=Turicimonas muris TaxID=1796652 RepID=UPI001ECCECB3|nr:hypothetical protein [Turicimonas muris]MBS4847126.1 hypothetical protein [Burkholderiales bacterium]